jgi:ZIP family zinc transporter
MIGLDKIWAATLFSFIAGMGTGLGGLLAVLRKPGKRSFGFLMGMTAGVMISLSFLELVNEAWKLQGVWTATIGFGTGAISMFALDVLLPHIRFGEREVASREGAVDDPRPQTATGASHPGRRRNGHGPSDRPVMDPVLLRSGTLLAIGITIHNLPEGIAVGAGYMHTPQFGMLIALAILLHNIPEGIATALPLCEAGMRRWDAFRIAFLSGLPEPIGALAAALFLQSFLFLIPGSLAFAGGVMMFITLDELIPTAREYGHQHSCAIGIILGSIFVFLLSGLLSV